MAVQRERLSSLINAAYAYRHLILELRRELHEEAYPPPLVHIDQPPRPPFDPKYYLLKLDTMIMEADAVHNGVLSAEFYRSRANEGKNRREKERMQKLRRERGAPVRQHIPLPINASSEVRVLHVGAPPEPGQSLSRQEVEAQFNASLKETDFAVLGLTPEQIKEMQADIDEMQQLKQSQKSNAISSLKTTTDEQGRTILDQPEESEDEDDLED